MTSYGVSLHASNGEGLTVSITGHLMVVETSLMGADVDRSCTAPLSGAATGLVCQTTITAATSAHIADSKRNSAAITLLRACWAFRGSVQVATPDPKGKEEHVLVAA